MMHGRGKSDSAIVAVKPTNKAGQPAAEPAEQRAEAEEKTLEESASDGAPSFLQQSLALAVPPAHQSIDRLAHSPRGCRSSEVHEWRAQPHGRTYHRHRRRPRPTLRFGLCDFG
jgi:hypothetical protein